MKFGKSRWGVFVFVFKLFPKTAVLLHTTFLYSCFLQKFGLKLFEVEPSRTFNGAFYISFPNNVNRENELPSIFNPYHPEKKPTTL